MGGNLSVQGDTNIGGKFMCVYLTDQMEIYIFIKVVIQTIVTTDGTV